MTRAERERQVQKQKSILYSCCIVVVVVLIVVVLVGIRNNSMEAKASVDGKYIYKSVLVESGDTLWSIASEHQDDYLGSLDEYVEEIKDINNLGTGYIDAGEYIIIPVYTKGF